MTHMLARHMFLISLVCAQLVENVRADQPASLRIEIKLEKTKYLRGEPVHLSVVETNTGKTNVLVWVDVVKHYIIFAKAHRDSQFTQVDIGQVNKYKLERYVVPLAPGASKSYDRVLVYTYYSSKKRSRRIGLVFDKVGTYRLKARHQLYKSNESFSSEPVRLEVIEPKGVDAKVWAEMKRPEFLCFLQMGIAIHDKGEFPPLTAARLLTKFPGSKYRPSLHRALKHFTEQNPGWFNFKNLTATDVKSIKQALATGQKKETSSYLPTLGITFALLVVGLMAVMVVRKNRLD